MAFEAITSLQSKQSPGIGGRGGKAQVLGLRLVWGSLSAHLRPWRAKYRGRGREKDLRVLDKHLPRADKPLGIGESGSRGKVGGDLLLGVVGGSTAVRMGAGCKAGAPQFTPSLGGTSANQTAYFCCNQGANPSDISTPQDPYPWYL